MPGLEVLDPLLPGSVASEFSDIPTISNDVIHSETIVSCETSGVHPVLRAFYPNHTQF